MACMWPERQQGTTSAVLQLQDAVQDLSMLEPASQCLTRQALAIVLQHHRSAACQHSLRTLLQVSKAWRPALLEAAAGQVDVSIDVHGAQELFRVVSLAAWLRKYGTCVRSLKIAYYASFFQDYDVSSRWSQAGYTAVSQIAATLEGGVLDHTTASLAPWSSLCTLDIGLPVDGSLLAVLPTSLTRMLITTKSSSTDFAALARLQNLRSLTLRSEESGSVNPHCFREVSRLPVLTTLVVWNATNNIQWRQVPVQLQNLSVENSCTWQTAGEMWMQLGHVVGLTRISLTCNGYLESCQLPANLRDLYFTCKPDMYTNKGIPAGTILMSLGVLGLTALTRLSLNNTSGGGHALAPLASLTQLQKVTLSWAGKPDELMSVASALCHVPGVLDLSATTRTANVHESERLMQQLGTLTQLTCLHLNELHVQRAMDAAAAGPVAICKHLSTLTSLQRLTLSANSSFVKHDIQHLTALRSLTHLSLSPQINNADYRSLPLPFRW